MNTIVHETVNNTVFDVDSKMHFEDVTQIFDEKNDKKLSIISKQISEFKFTKDQWIDLIQMINPFNPQLVMVDSQKNAFPFFNFVIRHVSNEDLVFFCNYPETFHNKSLLSMIGVINNGYKLFKFLEKKTNTLENKILWYKSDSVFNHLYDTSRYGNILNYLFLEEKTSALNIINLDFHISQSEDIFSNMCCNPDMRLMKHFLQNHSKIYNFNTNIIAILRNILSSHIPFKYQMRRLKLLNDHYNLIPHYHVMISDFNTLTYKGFITISKYYYKNPIFNLQDSSFNIFDNITQMLIKFNQTEETDILKEFYKIFTSVHINDFKQIIKNIYTKNCINSKILDSLNNQLKSDNYTDLLDINKLLSTSERNNQIFNHIKQITQYSCINSNTSNESTQCNNCECKIKLCSWNSLSYFLGSPNFYDSTTATSFLNSIPVFSLYNNDNIIIYLVLLIKVTFKMPTNVNKNTLNSISKGIRIRSLLKRALFRKINNSRKKQKINFKIVLNNLLTFKPNYDIPVLSNGSCLFRKSKQKLEKHKYPIHIDPCQMVWISKKDCFLREKADGIYTDSISFQHYPKVNIFNTNVIKSEFLEDDNLHLVFDIDLDDNISDRYQYLRKAHPFTKDAVEIEQVTNIDQFKSLLTAERARFSAFKNHVENNDIVDPIWYPKAAWFIKANSHLIFDITRIITNMNDSSDYDFLINQTEFPIDGYIIQPMDGSTEAKIKPNDQMTVDLLFDGTKWLTREKRQITNMNCKEIKLTKNIWRCYWIDGNWIPREIRWDKKIPNPNHIVDYLTNYNQNKWLVDDVLKFETSYYVGNNSDIGFHMIKTFQKQRDIQLYMFEQENCKMNSKWLDIGCGKGNSIKNINHFNPSHYIGFDNDPYCVWESNLRHSTQFHNFTLYDFSLKQDQNQFVSTVKINEVFDYIVCNFVLHYAAKSKDIWNRWIEQINNKSKSGTILFINFMDYDKLIKVVDNNEFYLDDKSYIKLLADSELNYQICSTWAEIKFDWVHPEPIREPVVTKDTVITEFSCNGWELQNEFHLNDYTTKYSTFSSIYTWLTLIKK